jgi:hypothetical protein
MVTKSGSTDRISCSSTAKAARKSTCCDGANRKKCEECARKAISKKLAESKTRTRKAPKTDPVREPGTSLFSSPGSIPLDGMTKEGREILVRAANERLRARYPNIPWIWGKGEPIVVDSNFELPPEAD